jgi:hypothetical protein
MRLLELSQPKRAVIEATLKRANRMSSNEKRPRSRMSGVEVAFAKSVGEALSLAGSDHGRLAALLREIRVSSRTQLRGNRALIQETGRRIAETLLHHAIRHGCSFDVCRARLNQLRKLGFSNIETKSTCYFLYARGALERGHRHAARRVAAAMADELEDYLRQKKSLAASEDLKLLRSLLKATC